MAVIFPLIVLCLGKKYEGEKFWVRLFSAFPFLTILYVGAIILSINGGPRPPREVILELLIVALLGCLFNLASIIVRLIWWRKSRRTQNSTDDVSQLSP